MTERPILFSGEMVRAILEGRKTQTRRVVKPQPQEGEWKHHPPDPRSYTINESGTAAYCAGVKCPYGQVGDRLWVRETWQYGNSEEYLYQQITENVIYKADKGSEDTKAFIFGGYHWRPSIFMPRWASRITLEVVNVRVERLQDISAADAIAEGVGWQEMKYAILDILLDPCVEYENLWDKINGKKYPWESNPWVWVIEFKKLEVA